MSKRFQKAGKASTPKPASTDAPMPAAQGGNTLAPAAFLEPKKGRPPVKVDLSVPFIDLSHQTSVIGGRPQSVGEMIGRMGSIGCTIVDLAGALGVSEQTMHEIFKRQPEVKKAWESGHLNARVSLRARLFQQAEKNAAPAIFLAKNMLGMRDQFEVSGEVNHRHSGLVSLMHELDGKGAKVIEGEVVDVAPTGGKQIEEQQR